MIVWKWQGYACVFFVGNGLRSQLRPANSHNAADQPMFRCCIGVGNHYDATRGDPEVFMPTRSRTALRAITSLAVLAAFAGAMTADPANAQQPAPQAQPAAPAVAPPKAYKQVNVQLPAAANEPAFASFRKQLADIAKRKDRAALQKFVVIKNFFWEGEGGNKLNPKASSFDNFASAISLDDKDDSGWEILAAAAEEPTLEADPDHNGVMCGPASPQIDEQAFVDLIKETGTDADEWGYPNAEKLEVRAAAKPDAPVIETVGMGLIRVYPEDNATTEPATTVRVVTPAGKLGYVPIASVLPIVTDQLCYIKDAGGWKIAGYAGGQ
jgi:hypothetical protein